MSVTTKMARSRPLEHNRTLAIVKDTDLEVTDEVILDRSQQIMSTGMEKEEEGVALSLSLHALRIM